MIELAAGACVWVVFVLIVGRCLEAINRYHLKKIIRLSKELEEMQQINAGVKKENE